MIIFHFPEDAVIARKLMRRIADLLPGEKTDLRDVTIEGVWRDLPRNRGKILLVSRESADHFSNSTLFVNIKNGLVPDDLALLADHSIAYEFAGKLTRSQYYADFHEDDFGIGVINLVMSISRSHSLLEPTGGRRYEIDNQIVINSGEGTYATNPILINTISEIGIPARIANVLFNREHIIYVGDLVQRSEVEILRIPDIGRQSNKRIQEVLGRYGLRMGLDLGTHWPPENIEVARDILNSARKVLDIQQAPLGATFELGSDTLWINNSGSDDDSRAAEKPVVQQLHTEVLRKAGRFRSVAPRLDNQMGWEGISSLSERLHSLLNRRIADIPAVLGSLYSAALELGSFLEMDHRLRSERASFAIPLDTEVRRPLEDLLSSLAPWMRSFPTIRELDNEAGQFQKRNYLVSNSSKVVDFAKSADLVNPGDFISLTLLLDASSRGELQSIKAGHRGVLSVRNMIVAATTAVGLFLLHSIEADFSTKSVLVQRAGSFLANAEEPILSVLRELPADLRLAIEAIINDLRDSPVIPSNPEGASVPPRRRSNRSNGD